MLVKRIGLGGINLTDFEATLEGRMTNEKVSCRASTKQTLENYLGVCLEL